MLPDTPRFNVALMFASADDILSGRSIYEGVGLCAQVPEADVVETKKTNRDKRKEAKEERSLDTTFELSAGVSGLGAVTRLGGLPLPSAG